MPCLLSVGVDPAASAALASRVGGCALRSFDFDISFNLFGAVNSRLLRTYTETFPTVRMALVLAKGWSISAQINNSPNGYLSSYAVVLLFLYYTGEKQTMP
jgi:DNA polymerase sigma